MMPGDALDHLRHVSRRAQRGMAIGIWAGVSALALAIGPLLGGIITEHISWNWIFFVNVPIGDPRRAWRRSSSCRSRTTPRREQRLDLPGLLTSGIGLFALVYALIEANKYGWTSARILGLFVARGRVARGRSSCSRCTSACRCSTSRSSATRTFAGANIVAMLLVTLAMFGVFFYVPLYVQNVLRLLADPGRGRRCCRGRCAWSCFAPIAGKRQRPRRLALADRRRDDASSPARS